MKKTEKWRIVLMVMLIAVFAGLLRFPVYAASGNVKIDSQNFPDETFRNYISKVYDEDKNGILSEAEIKEVEYLNFSYLVSESSSLITNLKGIEYFTELTYLNINSNNVESLDVSKNTKLVSLYCDSNKLNSLDVSKNIVLEDLFLYGNRLTQLDVSSNTSLRRLRCGLNPLTDLDLSKNTKLEYLDCDDCKSLKKFDISKNLNLTELDCSDNYLTSLDVSKNVKLTWLDCSFNDLYESGLDVSHNTELTYLQCTQSGLRKLDLSNNKKLKELSAGYNAMSKIDLTNNTELERLYVNNVGLKSLNLSKNKKLTYLRCEHNRITNLVIKNCTDLNYLECEWNDLKSLDISNSPNLEVLVCSYNTISELNIGNNPKLVNVFKNGKKVENYESDPVVGYKVETPYEFMWFNKEDENGFYKVISKSDTYRLNYIIYDKDTVLSTKLMPLDISVSNVAAGVKIAWKTRSGADKYCIYKKNEKGSWVKLETVSALKYTDKSAQPGEKCTYTVIARSSDGETLSSYGDGTDIVCSKPISVTAKYKTSGVALSWNKVGTAAKYRIFRKVGDGAWTKLATVTSASYVDTAVVYGKTYAYAVRAMSSNGSFITEQGDGTSITYLTTAPKVTLQNGMLGVNISWSVVTGAAKYRIFVQNTNGAWSKLATVKEGNSYTDTTAKVGKSYTYAVVGMDSAGRFMNDYGDGATIVREKTVLNFTLKSVAAGVKVSWKAADGAGKYRVYRKNSDGTWTTLVTIKEEGVLFYRDTTAENGKTYTYSVVAMSAGGSALTEIGDGQKIKYVQPVSVNETVEVSVTDADGNTVVYRIGEEEITEEYVDIIVEDSEESEDGTPEEAEDTSEETEEVVPEEAEDISEETEEVAPEEAEDISEETEEVAPEEAEDISEETEEVAPEEAEDISEESEEVASEEAENISEKSEDGTPEDETDIYEGIE